MVCENAILQSIMENGSLPVPLVHAVEEAVTIHNTAEVAVC